VLGSPESLARGKFPKGLSRNRRELPISSHTKRNAPYIGRYVHPRVDRRGHGEMASSLTTSYVRKQLVEMIEKRVNDGSVLRLIGKWIKVGVIEDGKLLRSETGTGQGQPISPLLANIFLHYVLDEWFEDVVKPR
jgi:hypothetical protein